MWFEVGVKFVCLFYFIFIVVGFQERPFSCTRQLVYYTGDITVDRC
jgi:hypothetical protein